MIGVEALALAVAATEAELASADEAADEVTDEAEVAESEAEDDEVEAGAVALES